MAQRWARLKREIDILRQHFLPDPFDPLGNYPNAARVQAHTLAFLVLSHAEIETFLEEWAKEIARACEQIWNTSKRVAAPMAFLVATIGDDVPVAAPNRGDCHQRFSDVVGKMFQTYYKQITDNNGVKEKNFLDLFDPLGVPASAVSATLLPNLNNLGQIRGEHAHRSRKAVQSTLDPETEYNRVNAVLVDLQTFEDWLVRYRRSAR